MSKAWALALICAAGLCVASCGNEAPSQPPSAPQIAAETDLPLPDEARLEEASRSAGFKPAFDPLLVKNIDVADPLRREPIESVRFHLDGMPDGLELDGVIRTEQAVPIVDSDGKQVFDEAGRGLVEIRWVCEFAFKGHRRLYRAGEKVEGTDWRIPDDWQPLERVTRWQDQPRGDGDRPRRRNPYVPPGYMPPYGPHNR